MLLPVLSVSILEPPEWRKRLHRQLEQSIFYVVRHASGTACRETRPSPSRRPAQEFPANHCWCRTFQHPLQGMTTGRWEKYSCSIVIATLTQIFSSSECSRSVLCRRGANSTESKAPMLSRSLLGRTLPKNKGPESFCTRQ